MRALIGRPTHWKTRSAYGSTLTGCGRIGPFPMAETPEQVTCMACRATKSWRAAHDAQRRDGKANA